MMRATVALIGVLAFGLSAIAPQSTRAQNDRGADYEKNRELGLQHATAWDLYRTLQEQAGGGEPLTWAKIPDWSGIYTRVMGNIGTGQIPPFDSDQPPDELPSAKLTPEFQSRLLEKIRLADEGREFHQQLQPSGVSALVAHSIPPGIYDRAAPNPIARWSIVSVGSIPMGVTIRPKKTVTRSIMEIRSASGMMAG